MLPKLRPIQTHSGSGLFMQVSEQDHSLIFERLSSLPSSDVGYETDF